MVKVIYNSAVFLWLFALLPRVIWQILFYKKYRGSWKERLLTPKLFDTKGREVIWFHAASLGETSGAIPLVKRYRTLYPNAFLLFSCITETGAYNIASKMPQLDAQIYLPLDFSFLMKKLMRHYRPKRLFIVESEFWFNFIREAKLVGAEVILINGKISLRSFERFQYFPRFSKRLFSHFDRLCMQNDYHTKRIKQFAINPNRVKTTGNMKFDIEKRKMNEEEKQALKSLLGIHDHEKIVLIASSHYGEEKELLNSLKELIRKHPYMRILIAPRHPERFESVGNEILKAGFQYEKYEERLGKRVILVNRMGIMDLCYQIADAVIMAGSFNPKIGGHNLLEPIEFHKLTLFGPYMHSQQQLWEDVLRYEAGTQIELHTLSAKLDQYFSDPTIEEKARENAERLLCAVKGSVERTIQFIDSVEESV